MREDHNHDLFKRINTPRKQKYLTIALMVALFLVTYLLFRLIR
jgi:hypothetical protein